MRGAGRQVASSRRLEDASLLASRAAISVRPGPALLPRRIAYRAFAVSAPHLGLTLVLPELRRSTERAGLWGTRTPSLARTLLRRSDLPSRDPPGSRAAGAASPPPPRSGARQLPRGRRVAAL